MEILIEKQCIFCRGDASSSQSEGHIVPKFMLNTKRFQKRPADVLAKGMECDTCNNGPISSLEKYFAEAGAGLSFKLKCISLGIQIPKGVTVRSDARSDSIVFPGETPKRLVEMIITKPEPMTSECLEYAARDIRFTITFILDKKRHRISGFLSKMLIEIIARVGGREVALNPCLDPHRENVLNNNERTWMPYFVCTLPIQEGAPLWSYDFNKHALVLFVRVLSCVYAIPVIDSFSQIAFNTDDGSETQLRRQAP